MQSLHERPLFVYKGVKEIRLLKVFEHETLHTCLCGIVAGNPRI